MTKILQTYIVTNHNTKLSTKVVAGSVREAIQKLSETTSQRKLHPRASSNHTRKYGVDKTDKNQSENRSNLSEN